MIGDGCGYDTIHLTELCIRIPVADRKNQSSPGKPTGLTLAPDPNRYILPVQIPYTVNMAIIPVHVDGTDKGTIMLYALSTCVHCKMTKELLADLGVAFDYLYVDQLSRDEMNQVLMEVEKVNPRGSFPTLVINGTRTIIGSRLDEIKEALA